MGVVTASAGTPKPGDACVIRAVLPGKADLEIHSMNGVRQAYYQKYEVRKRYTGRKQGVS